MSEREPDFSKNDLNPLFAFERTFSKLAWDETLQTDGDVLRSLLLDATSYVRQFPTLQGLAVEIQRLFSQQRIGFFYDTKEKILDTNPNRSLRYLYGDEMEYIDTLIIGRKYRKVFTYRPAIYFSPAFIQAAQQDPLAVIGESIQTFAALPFYLKDDLSLNYARYRGITAHVFYIHTIEQLFPQIPLSTKQEYLKNNFPNGLDSK